MLIDRKCERCRNYKPGQYYITKKRNSDRCIECRIFQYQWVYFHLKEGRSVIYDKDTIQTTIPMYFEKI